MWDHEEKTTLRELFRALLNLVEDLQKALKKYLVQAENPPPPVHATTLQGDLPMNQQINSGDSIAITITDTVDATGLPATVDAGSLTATLSDTTDTVSVSGSTVTVTAGTNLATSKTVTVNATVNGVASTPWVGSYDVVAAVVEPTSTTLSGTFAGSGETAPPSGAATLPVAVTLPNGAVLPAGSPLPAGTTYSAASNELVNVHGTAYQG